MVLFRFCTVLFLFFCFSVFANAQDLSFLKTNEDSIVTLWKQIKTANNDSDKLSLNLSISNLFRKVFEYPESFTYSFDSLSQFGKIYSPDNFFRILTWNLILRDGTQLYYGFIQTKKNKNNTYKIFELTDRASEIINPENSVLSAGKWFGGLYYKILPNKIDHITYYTLLSLRYNNLFTSSKIIDILYFDEFGNPVFGAPLFVENKNVKLRVVFEYSANVAMNLNYNEDLKLIVFDHLSPSESVYKGQYQYYGPDFTFDGYKFKNNKWNLISDLDLKRPADSYVPPVKSKPVSNKITR